jgi:multicomponent Na+:H+ antiporter subunit D
MFSGVVVKAGVFPLVRCALLLEEINPVVRIFGVATAFLGVCGAIAETDTKRTLAFSTVSQLGFVLAAPMVAGFYALTHGLVKAALFLLAGNLPSRSFKQLQSQPISNSMWIALVIASFSISGFPLLSGFGAKVLTSKNYLPWQVIAMNVIAVGTAICYAKFIFLPYKKSREKGKVRSGLWGALVILLGGLIAANGFYYQAYTVENLLKPLGLIVIGWLIYFFIVKKFVIKLPRVAEQFNHLIGMMSVMLIIVFWMVQVQN